MKSLLFLSCLFLCSCTQQRATYVCDYGHIFVTFTNVTQYGLRKQSQEVYTRLKAIEQIQDLHEPECSK